MNTNVLRILQLAVCAAAASYGLHVAGWAGYGLCGVYSFLSALVVERTLYS
jgi:hypothetical protein